MLIQLLKVHAAERLVEGRIDETPDRTGEVFDYASSKPLFQKWSDEIAKATGGASVGNVRAMHGKTAAGKLEKITFDDAGKAIGVTARIVDDAEWRKVQAGVYTGFSPGGRYVKTWQDGQHTRYTAEPHEISLVDLPCIPSATFSLVKAAGETVEQPFAAPTVATVAAEFATVTGSADWRAVVTAMPAQLVKLAFASLDDVPDMGLAKKAFSADERQAMADKGEAMPDGSFPIGDKDDLKNAVHAIGRAKDPAAAKRHIARRAKELGATDMLPADWDGSTQTDGNGDGSEKMAAGELAKMAAKVAAGRDELEKAQAENARLAKRVAELEALPGSGGPRLTDPKTAGDAGKPRGDAAPGPDLSKLTFDEAVAAINKMAPGEDRSRALRALAERSTDTTETR